MKIEFQKDLNQQKEEYVQKQIDGKELKHNMKLKKIHKEKHINQNLVNLLLFMQNTN